MPNVMRVVHPFISQGQEKNIKIKMYKFTLPFPTISTSSLVQSYNMTMTFVALNKRRVTQFFLQNIFHAKEAFFTFQRNVNRERKIFKFSLLTVRFVNLRENVGKLMAPVTRTVMPVKIPIMVIVLLLAFCIFFYCAHVIYALSYLIFYFLICRKRKLRKMRKE